MRGWAYYLGMMLPIPMDESDMEQEFAGLRDLPWVSLSLAALVTLYVVLQSTGIEPVVIGPVESTSDRR